MKGPTWQLETMYKASDIYSVGEVITVSTGERLQIIGIERKTLTVQHAPTERQETLGRLTGRPPSEFIP